MEEVEELFNRDLVKGISTLVENKMEILKKVKDFEKKDRQLSSLMEELDKQIPKELKDKFDDLIRINYQIEEYYFTLAYLLGEKYGKQMNIL